MTTEKSADVDERDESKEQGTEAKGDVDLDEERLGEQIDGKERWKDDETVSDKATCSECGEPVHNLRMACPKCGHEYKDKEYDDNDAGTEFRAGAEVDDDEIGEKVKDSHSEARSGSDEEDDENEE